MKVPSRLKKFYRYHYILVPVIATAVLASVAVLYPQRAAVLGDTIKNFALPKQTLINKEEITQNIVPTSTPTPTPTPVPLTPTPTAVKSDPIPPQTSPPVVNNAPPGAGYQRQNVQTDAGTFIVDVIGADLNSTKVIVDTASDSDCGNNCPVMPLASYASRSGAYAGINGSYFCPPEYPSCAGKTNSFDTLLMNKNKVYFNSANNVYSTVPAAIFSPGSARFVSRSLEWGRDTGVDGVIANYPLLVTGSNINFTEAPNEPKFGGKAVRTFIANRGSMIYIGIVRSATMSDSAKVLKTMSMDNALNLDQGGSTALWFGGRYLAGPGRNIPNAILFINR